MRNFSRSFKNFILKYPLVRRNSRLLYAISRSATVGEFLFSFSICTCIYLLSKKSKPSSAIALLFSALQQYSCSMPASSPGLSIIHTALLPYIDNKHQLYHLLKAIPIAERSPYQHEFLTLIHYQLYGLDSEWHSLKRSYLDLCAQSKSLDASKLLIFGDDWFTAFGHLAILAYLTAILEQEYVFIISNGVAPANPALFKKITSQSSLYFLTPIEYASLQVLYPDCFVQVDSNRFTPIGEDPLASTIHKWASSDHTHLFTYTYDEFLSSSPSSFHINQIERLRLFDSFVTLHVRGNGAKAIGGSTSRNAAIENFLPTIELLSSRGIAVAVLGDHYQLALNDFENVVQISHQPDSDRSYDLFALANCRFHIGTSSGPVNVPPLFGKPVLLTNSLTPFNQAHFPNSLQIPKSWVSNGQLLDFCSFARSPHAVQEVYDANTNTYAIENSASDILSAVMDILDLISPNSVPYPSYFEHCKAYQDFLRLNELDYMPNHLPLAPSYMSKQI